jgi:hypothetical protein
MSLPTIHRPNSRPARMILALILLTLSFAGCGPAAPTPNPDSGLPTVAQLPTLTQTLTPAPETPAPTQAATSTPSLTPTATLSVTPSATITETPTPTPSDTPTVTPTPPPTADNEGLVALALLAAQATIITPVPLVPTVALPTSPPLQTTTCVYPPPGGFAALTISDPTITQQIGCPLGAPPAVGAYSSASQLYERGEMFWLAGPPAEIIVFYSSGRYQRFDDTFVSGVDPESGAETPPAGLTEPVRGFGKVWRSYPDVRNGLGWAVTGENAGQATVQLFERGRMIYLSQRGLVFILAADPGGAAGLWRSVPGSF